MIVFVPVFVLQMLVRNRKVSVVYCWEIRELCYFCKIK